MESPLLIVFGTTDGHTARIVERLSETLLRRGIAVEAYQGNQLPPGLDLSRYRGVVLGASVHYSAYQNYIIDFIINNQIILMQLPCFFFSVSGAACSQDPAMHAQANQYMDRLFSRLQWRPSLSQGFAGAILYRQYGWIKRFIMKMVSRTTGRSTDTSRDHICTDWKQVERFADRIQRLLQR